VHPCTRPATASQARGPDSPHGISGAALASVATSVSQMRHVNRNLNCLVPFSVPRRSRRQGARADPRALRQTLDASAATWPSPSPGNSARTETNMSRTTLYTKDSSTPTGIREASFDEIVTAARGQMSLRVRRGTSLSSPRATRDYLALKLGTLERGSLRRDLPRQAPSIN
jgi:hypothetical protein